MRTRYVLKIAVFTIFVAVTGLAIFLHKDISEKPVYVSSEKCKDCHERYYKGWKSTLHPIMFRPVKSPDDILGDFESGDPAVTFKKEDIEFVVGNKWEQVYVRMIEGEYYPFPAKWYVILKKWVPYKVDDWKEVKMSVKCNGCHTTGFDPETFKFNEFGIGCEACHGPGSVHVQNKRKRFLKKCSPCHGSDDSHETDIIRSFNSAVCGRCHNRGVSIPQSEAERVRFDFPVKGAPGEELGAVFRQMTAGEDKKNEFWWGNGISRNRHQEFADWQQSKHSKALKLMKEKHTYDRGKVDNECLKCHSTDYRFAKEGKEPDVDSAKHGVTCVACHEPHGLDRQFSFTRDGTYICAACHIDSISFKTAKKSKPHYPCPPAKVTCADCHMPYIVETGGFYSIRSHAFRVIPPEEGEKFGLPNSCQNGKCHQDKSIDWAKREFGRHYPAFGKTK